MKIVYNKAIPFILTALVSAPALSMLAPETTDDNTLLPTASAQLDDNVQASKWQKSIEALKKRREQLKILWESDEPVSEERKETRRILEDALYKELHGLLPTRIAEQSVDLKNTQKALSVEQVRTVLEEIHEIIGWRGISVDEDFREFVEDNLREQFSEVQKRIQNASFTETEKESLQKLQEEIFKEFEKQFPSAATRCRLAAEQESPKAQQRLAALPSSLDI